MTPCTPNSRPKPASGLIRVKSGVIAAGLKFQPPSITDASNTSAATVPNSGSRAATEPVAASPSEADMESRLCRRSGATVNESRMMVANRPARVPPMATRVALPPSMVAKLTSSRDLGT